MKSENRPAGILTAKKYKTALVSIVLIVVLFAPFAATAQYTKLYDFGNTAGGATPYSSPISDGTFLYGTTSGGGLYGAGTIYKIKTDGSGYAKLLDFDGNNGSSPLGSLYYDGTFLYGTASGGGSDGHGTIFKLMPDGTGFTKLLDLIWATNGAFPLGALISDGTFLYGTTSQGGASYAGTLFKIKPDGSGFVKLLDFDGTAGGYLSGSLYSDGTFLYGMTNGGGSYPGSIFKIMPDGTGFTTLHTFSTTDNGLRPFGSLIQIGTYLYGMTSSIGDFTHYGRLFKIMPDGTGYTDVLDFNNSSIGANPKGSLVFDGTFLYGMTTDYGANNNGTIFKVKPDGSGFVKLLDNDLNTLNPNPEGTLCLIGTTLYGARSGLFSSDNGIGYLGAIFKINTDGSAYTKIHTFEVTGNTPVSTLVLNGTSLYGTTSSGGIGNYGTIFTINSDGTGFTDLYDFTGTADGNGPVGQLISDGTYFYGMTNSGGANQYYGTVYKILPNGSGFTKLLDFDNSNNGNSPNGSLYYDGSSFLYGMTTYGGANGSGTLFKIQTNGSGYVKLLDFDNTNGGNPYGSLISDGTYLYGMTNNGGSAGGYGTLFKIMPDGTNYTAIVNFDFSNTGAYPGAGSLIYDGTFLYGMTSSGGANSSGVIFKVKTDGTAFTRLFDFDGATNGGSPNGSLLLNGTYLYGMTTQNGENSIGTVFKIKTDGTGYTKLFDFNDGGYPQASLISDGIYLYGTTQEGGLYGLGTLFKTSMTPFTYISNFSPSYGVTGTFVTINGANFDPIPANTTVEFNNMNAKVVSATATTLTVIVPAGATTGPISVSAITIGTSTSDFNVTTQAEMFDGMVQNCNVPFEFSGSSGDMTETFLPVNPTDKVKVSFSSFDVGDYLYVYDGPTVNSPLIATLYGNTLPADIIATGPGGELTFLYSWQDSGSDWVATISCQSVSPPVIDSTTVVIKIGGVVTLNLVSLITTSNNNLDTTSLQVVVPPPSGASTSISTAGVLTIDYTGISFSGAERISIQACDKNKNCATQRIKIEVVGDIVVYNGVSPHGTNPSLVIQYIDVLPDTKNNSVRIFDRWENSVWHGNNYDNTSVVFTGISDTGTELPTGVYFYKIDFASGKKSKTGFISLRRQ